MHVKNRNIRELAALVHDAAEGLSARAVAVLVAHPDAVRSALAVAAESLSAKSARDEDGHEAEIIGDAEAPVVVDVKEASRRIAARTRPDGEGNLLTSDELAARVGFRTRQSVHDWLKRDRIIGWQGAKRGHVFPAGQLDRRSRPLKGLDRIAPYFDDGHAAWVWLTTPRPSLDGAKPIALLHRGEIDQVVAAVEGDFQGDFA